MTTLHIKNIALTLALFAGSGGTAHAAVIIYHEDAAALQGAIADTKFEDFEDLTLLDGLTISGTGNIATGALYRQLLPNRPSVISFSESVFGLGGLIRSSGFGALELTLTFDDGSQQILEAFNVGPDIKRYLGFTSDVGIRSVSMKPAGAAGVQMYMDDLTYGEALAVAAVPEPATWAMMIIGFAAVGSSMRRRSPNMQISFV